MRQALKVNKTYWAVCLFFFAIVISGCFFLTQNATAADWVITPPPKTAEGLRFCPERQDGISGRVVSCIQAIVIASCKKFLAGFMAFYTPIVIAALTLSITFYGAMFLSGGVRRPTTDTLILLLKIAAVAFFTVQFGGMTESVFNIMEGLASIVSNYSLTSEGLALCSKTNALPFMITPRANPTAWDKIDCTFITMLGIGGGAVVMGGLVAILGGMLFTGGIGLIIFLMAFMFLLNLLMAVVRSAKIYLQAVIAVALLICISPLTIPCILFKETMNIFQKWVGQLIANIFIAMFVMAYLSIIVATIDAIIFRGPNSLYYAIARDASQEDNFDFGTWLRDGKDGAGHQVGKDVPGINAIGLLEQIKICTSGTKEEKDRLQGMCDDMAQLRSVQRCAVNPWLPNDGTVEIEIDASKGESCEDIPSKMDFKGHYYYGFLKNEEILFYSITPGIKTDAQKRKEAAKCKGIEILCLVTDNINDFIMDVQGFIVELYGTIWSAIGSTMKAVGGLVSAPCRLLPNVAGDACYVGTQVATGGTGFLLSFAGEVVHTAGSIAAFSGRVMQDGFMKALGLERIDGWFDVSSIDLQKVTSYRCKVDRNLTDISSQVWLDCPGVEALVMEILYVLITGVIALYLIISWLSYIPVLAHALTEGNAYISGHVPGEERLTGPLKKGIKNLSSHKFKFRFLKSK